MNDILRIARLKIALQRAFLGRAILIFTFRGRDHIYREGKVYKYTPIYKFQSAAIL